MITIQPMMSPTNACLFNRFITDENLSRIYHVVVETNVNMQTLPSKSLLTKVLNFVETKLGRKDSAIIINWIILCQC